jgi:hypothetical protein
MTSSQTMEATMKVRHLLLALQKEILDNLKETFEKENTRNVGPGEWLQVLMVSQRYHWLRELTLLITDIDILTELQEMPEDQVTVVRSEIERLFFSPQTTSEFSKSYRQLMTAEAPFILTQGLLKEATQKLPVAKKAHSAEDADRARKEWQEQHKNQTRKRRS